jgi:hypothetical protein
MSRSPLYVNNPSAYIHQIMDRVAGKPEFGSGWGAKSVKLAEVPKDLRPLVSKLVGGKDTFATSELQRKLFDADFALQREDKGIFGRGILGLIGGGDGILSEKEQARAMRKDANVKPVLDYIFESRAKGE